MKNKKIALDIDNVCLNFSKHFIDYLGFDNTSMPTNYRDSRFLDYFKLVNFSSLKMSLSQMLIKILNSRSKQLISP